jgi:hypothetical protein
MVHTPTWAKLDLQLSESARWGERRGAGEDFWDSPPEETTEKNYKLGVMQTLPGTQDAGTSQNPETTKNLIQESKPGKGSVGGLPQGFAGHVPPSPPGDSQQPYGSSLAIQSEVFGYAGFGTIAHICAEALLSGKEAVIPPGLAGLLSPADAETLLGAGRETALRFVQSPLGAIAQKAENRKSEFQFRSLLYDVEDEMFINGTIDLIFEDAETVYVVDFKTDSEEVPQLHLAQMACYCRAASDLFASPKKKKIQAWLYYLRSGHAVDVSRQAGDFSP